MARRKKNEDLKKKDGLIEEEGGEKLGSKILLFFVTILIILIWLGILAILIKTDVGGFGSSVLTPVLKDVPYVNQILPPGNESIDSTQDTQYPYDSIDDAVDRIKELERQLEEANVKIETDAQTVASLQEQVAELSVYKEEEAKFEELKEKFYEEVVFSEEAPDIEEYKIFYESIEPANAEVLYKQVVKQYTQEEEVQNYINTYSEMKAKDAAAIFDTMTDNFGLVSKILLGMNTEQRAAILQEMDEQNAATLTAIMEPED